mgnify:CR=1 FL=1
MRQVHKTADYQVMEIRPGRWQILHARDGGTAATIARAGHSDKAREYVIKKCDRMQADNDLKRELNK